MASKVKTFRIRDDGERTLIIELLAATKQEDFSKLVRLGLKLLAEKHGIGVPDGFEVNPEGRQRVLDKKTS